ncbi:AraC family transcriptional regulator [Nostoc sp. ChiQUE01b]|uniref:AraC family transcriptional regulator n=1 Tax=Nostoc sp. ChiQUE01b TaxID=3075376 RepID=UPI002AD25A13|nr:AraC family transcriptional regulator [Nostoc sp. ChiQUE01b]MDZ8263994.1 AraC family transcriptional regulator [Nostoc sp. ChiQUE01b]
MEQTVRKQQSELATLIAQNSNGDGVHPTAIERLFLFCSSQPTAPLHALHEPSLCIVAQGKKQVMLADNLYVYGQDQYLVVSIDLPVVGQVIEATPSVPYLCLRVDLDPGELSTLMSKTRRSR